MKIVVHGFVTHNAMGTYQQISLDVQLVVHKHEHQHAYAKRHDTVTASCISPVSAKMLYIKENNPHKP